ncbi:trans-sulfuration enzyme family protein [Actinokineospora globicatena]|uniref:trans-sulfuration enzyme family protein n=1 Tax=Actinokineospora globicatena TaxID=103729 RepID=UPI0020A42918|nr:PLP-dependent aspartate aminotransferase family protein [Actinokineospora globicatena]MCP2303621.1 cystathionine gamma-lyase [Actinokineospora globicatena]GLW79242.1 cystathionine beta-lyase [Actinokineospora globicatena]GLW86348.1 cystathionine beta-lyase [Actinokineospora globicatena]
MRFATRVVHSGHEVGGPHGSVVPPIHVATTYDRYAQDPPTHFYSRGENPTMAALEQCLAAVEGAAHCAVFSSGQAAATTALSLLSPGQRLVCCDDVYGGTHALITGLRRFGVRVDQVDLSDREQARAALAEDVAMVWLETPTNPLLKVIDIAEVAGLAHARGALVVVDNTFASPALQRPLRWGADVSLHSTTKFVAGHSDVLGGALVCDDPALHRAFTGHRTVAGNVPSGLDCFLVHRGVKTLSVRVERQVRTAQALVDLLLEAPGVTRVLYPGLPDHPGHEIAARQLSAPGSIISFRYAGQVEKLLAGTELFACAVSLGGVRSLIECPALMTHRPVPVDVRAAAGITDDLIRLSVGIEDATDLADDLSTALANGL